MVNLYRVTVFVSAFLLVITLEWPNQASIARPHLRAVVLEVQEAPIVILDEAHQILDEAVSEAALLVSEAAHLVFEAVPHTLVEGKDGRS